MNVTAHRVDDNCQPLSAVLQAHSLEERHTEEYIAKKISNIMSEWEIDTTQMHCVVWDNGSIMVKAMSEGGLPNFGCFTHSLQLDGLLSQHVVIDFLAVCRSIIGH